MEGTAPPPRIAHLRGWRVLGSLRGGNVENRQAGRQPGPTGDEGEILPAHDDLGKLEGRFFSRIGQSRNRRNLRNL
jgi:hypothetical protein